MLSLIANIKNIPELPQVAYKILEEAAKDDCNYNKLSEYVKNSPALSLKIFQIINSPFYNLNNKVTNLTQAIGLLGLNSIKNMALCLFIVDIVKKLPGNNKNNSSDKWLHLIVTANAAKLISKKEEYFFASLIALLPEYIAICYNQHTKNLDYNFFVDSLEILKNKWFLPEDIVNIVKDFYLLKFKKETKLNKGKYIFVANILADSLTLKGVKKETFRKVKKSLNVKDDELLEIISLIENHSSYIINLFDLHNKTLQFSDLIPTFELANDKIFNIILENEKLLKDYTFANEILNSALNNLFYAVLMFEDSDLILMNSEAEKLFGKNISKLEDIIDENLATQINSQKLPVRLITTLKKNIPVELTYTEIINNSNCKTTLLIIKDLTEELKLKKQYKNLKESYASLLNSAGIGICLIDTNGKVLFANKKVCDILKTEYKKITGTQLLDILCLSKKCMNNVYPVLKKIYNNKIKEATVEIESMNSKKEKLFLECTITLYKEGNFVVGFQFIINDITKKKELEAENQRLHDEFVEMEKDRVTIELAGATAHELNQPLTTLMLAADMLKIKKSADEVLIDKIEKATERLSNIVKKLSKITKYETKNYIGKSKIVDLEVDNE